MAINIMDEKNCEFQASNDMFVECRIDVQEVVFVQRDGRWVKENYDANDTDHKNPNVEISFDFFGEKKDGSPFGPVSRNMMMRQPPKKGAKAEWKDIVLPSLKKLGITDPVAQLNNKWVYIQMIGTGSFFVSRNNEEIERTAPVFLQVFANKDEAIAAQEAFWGERSNGDGNGNDTTPTNGNGVHANGNGNRAVAMQLLTSIVQAAKSMPNPRDGLATMMGSNPMFADAGLTVDSPEVVALLNGDEIPF